MPKRIIIPKNVVNPRVTTVIEIPDELQNVSPLVVNRTGQDSSLGTFPSELAENLSEIVYPFPEFEESPPNINTSAYQSSSGNYPSGMMSNLTDYSPPQNWGDFVSPPAGMAGYDSSTGNYPSDLMQNMSDPSNRGSPGLPWSQEYNVSHPHNRLDETYIVERPDVTGMGSQPSPMRRPPRCMQNSSLGILRPGELSPGFQNQGGIEGFRAIPVGMYQHNLATPMLTPPSGDMFNPPFASTPTAPAGRIPRPRAMRCRRRLRFCPC